MIEVKRTLLKLVQISLKSSCFEIKRLRRVTWNQKDSLGFLLMILLNQSIKKKLFMIIDSLPNQKPPPIYYDIHPTYVHHVRCYPGDCGEPEIRN